MLGEYKVFQDDFNFIFEGVRKDREVAGGGPRIEGGRNWNTQISHRDSVQGEGTHQNLKGSMNSLKSARSFYDKCIRFSVVFMIVRGTSGAQKSVCPKGGCKLPSMACKICHALTSACSPHSAPLTSLFHCVPQICQIHHPWPLLFLCLCTGSLCLYCPPRHPSPFPTFRTQCQVFLLCVSV